MAADINRAVISGRLTRDPELRSTASGMSILNMRVAFTTRRKSGDAWEDKPNYIDAVLFGKRAESIEQYLTKGTAVMLDGQLEWREWESKDGKRQSVDLVVSEIKFDNNAGEKSERPARPSSAPSDPYEDDIPF